MNSVYDPSRLPTELAKGYELLAKNALANNNPSFPIPPPNMCTVILYSHTSNPINATYVQVSHLLEMET